MIMEEKVIKMLSEVEQCVNGSGFVFRELRIGLSDEDYDGFNEEMDNESAMQVYSVSYGGVRAAEEVRAKIDADRAKGVARYSVNGIRLTLYKESLKPGF